MRMWILAKMVQMSLVPRYGWRRGKAESDDIIIKDLLQWLAGWTRLLYWAQILHLNLPLSTKKRSVVVESERTQMFSLFSSSLSASWLASSSSSACSTISPQNLEYFLVFSKTEILTRDCKSALTSGQLLQLATNSSVAPPVVVGQPAVAQPPVLPGKNISAQRDKPLLHRHILNISAKIQFCTPCLYPIMQNCFGPYWKDWRKHSLV